MTDRRRKTASMDDDVEERFGPLVDRVRQLRWPEPPPGVRERTLEQLKCMLSENGNGTTADADWDRDGAC